MIAIIHGGVQKQNVAPFVPALIRVARQDEGRSSAVEVGKFQ